MRIRFQSSNGFKRLAIFQNAPLRSSGGRKSLKTPTTRKKIASFSHRSAIDLNVMCIESDGPCKRSNPQINLSQSISLTQTHSPKQASACILSKHSTHKHTHSHPEGSCGDNVCAVVEVCWRRKWALAPSYSSWGGMFIVSSVFDLAQLIASCTLYVNCHTATEEGHYMCFLHHYLLQVIRWRLW